VLQGSGVLYRLAYKALNTGLYLPAKQTSLNDVLAAKGPKRLHLVAMREITSRDLSNIMLDAIRANVSREEVAVNIFAMAELGAMFNSRDRVVKGDTIFIDYNAATQLTEFSVNGQRVGTIKSEAPFSMLLKIWLGPNVRASTREGVSGIKAP
jgi:hypothetical protein